MWDVMGGGGGGLNENSSIYIFMYIVHRIRWNEKGLHHKIQCK